MKGTLLVAALFSSAALAQTDEWTTFPNSPSSTDKPVAPPPPVPPRATETTPPPPHQDPGAKSRVEERLRAAESGKPISQNSPVPQNSSVPQGPRVDGVKADGSQTDLPIVGRQERVEPGTEPHSPSTWGKKLIDDNARTSVTTAGIGIVRVQSARLGPAGVLRFSLLGEYTNLNNFPIRDAQDIRSAVTFAVSFVPVKFLEAYLAYGAMANTNSRTSPNLIQALGDLTLGVKGSLQASKSNTSALRGLFLGLDLRLLTFSAVGNQSLDRFAVGFKPTFLTTYDFRALTPKFPLLLSLNLGFTLDSTSGLVSQQTLNASEEFALAVNRYHRFDLGVGIEVPFPVVTPFVEYILAAPLGVPSTFAGPDGVRIDAAAAMPQKLSFGLKVTAIKDLTLLVGLDVGLAQRVGLGIAATAPWNLIFGASFNIDPFQRGETKIVETIRERTKAGPEAPKTGKFEGVVVDAKTQKPIPGVVLTVVGSGLPPVASDLEAGHFMSYEMKPGPAKLRASRDGYLPVEQDLTIEMGKTLNVPLQMESQVKGATFSVTVLGAKKPIAATLTFKGAETHAASTVKDVKEPVKVEVPAGPYNVKVVADGFLAQERDLQVGPGLEMPLRFDLQPAPKKMLAIIKDDRIEISQQVHFQSGKATILADSFSLLQQVVDVMVKNNIKRVRVEGHTDNRGDKSANKKLSEERAKAVVDYLSTLGIEASRLESEGFGDTKPVAPNLTARGRELNRRVEFIILEK